MRAHERMKKLLFTNHFSSSDPNSIFSNVQSPGEIDNFFFFKGLASHCKAKTTFTFYFSIINASESILQC